VAFLLNRHTASRIILPVCRVVSQSPTLRFPAACSGHSLKRIQFNTTFVLVLFDVSRAWSGVRDMTMLTELTGGTNDVVAGQRKNGDQAVEHRRENHMRRMLFYNFYKTTKTWRDVDISNEYQAESHVKRGNFTPSNVYTAARHIRIDRNENTPMSWCVTRTREKQFAVITS
jgi:hypothetical protein